jgi:hypothetical protein
MSSAGHSWRKDLTGVRFGRLTVIGPVARQKDKSNFKWICRCDCGTVKDIPVNHFKTGHTKSCGCYNRELAKQKGLNSALPKGEAALNHLIKNYKAGAHRRGYSWELTKEQFLSLTRGNCHYCGAAPKNITHYDAKCKARGGGYSYNGVDRVDNSLGYTIKNCVPCCYACNVAKMCRNADEFKKWIKEVFTTLFCTKDMVYAS